MVQTISLESLTKEIQPQHKKVNISNNIDFLELLMSEENNTDTKEKETPILKKNNKLILNELIEEKEIDTKLQIDNTNIKIPIQDEHIKEIKNIITSNLKQQNILLSKQEIQEFKKITNIKELIKFADKKGLNIKKINFEIEKVITKKQQTPTLPLKEKLKPIQTNSNPIQIKNTKSPQPKKEIKLENILNNEITNPKKQSQLIIKQTKTEKKTKETIIQKDVVISKKQSQTISKTINNEPTPITPQKQSPTPQPTIKQHILKKEVHSEKIDLTSLLNKDNPKHTEIKNNDTHIQTTPSQINYTNEIKVKTIQAKQTIDSFKNNLDEAIKNYKPPISKVNIELNPKNLGKVDVTIIQRGNNIQVNMNSDINNINLFQTHQTEFRQALINIGFSNIDMNFNSNQEKERKQNQAKKTYNENSELEEISEIEIKASYQYA